MIQINRFMMHLSFTFGLILTSTCVLGDGITVDPQGGVVNINNNVVGKQGTTGTAGANGFSNGNPGGLGGPGGPGGLAIQWLSNGTVNVGDAVLIQGGNGGAGGKGGDGAPGLGPSGPTGNGGDGGKGGDGGASNIAMMLPLGAVLNNRGSIVGGAGGGGGRGGDGGAGGDPFSDPPGTPGAPGARAAGSIAIQMQGNSTLTNTGTIKGGAGEPNAVAIRVNGSGNRLVNSGTIDSGDSGVNSVEISGSNNVLELQAGASFGGNVVATGAANQLVLGGDTNAAIAMTNVGPVGSGALMQGFTGFTKTGKSTWSIVQGPVYSSVASLPWSIQSGVLQAGAPNVLSSGAHYMIAPNAVLDLNGFSQSVGNVSNAGVVKVGGNDRAGVVLNVAGTYTSNGGSLALNAKLEGNDSVTDRMVAQKVVLGAAGPTRLTVINTKGMGALTTGNGIELITVKDSASAADAFVLNGRVAAGAYEYHLIKKGTNWYLDSGVVWGTLTNPDGSTTTKILPNYRQEIPLNLAIPALTSRIGQAMLGSYEHRMAKGKDAIWSRVLKEKGSVGTQNGNVVSQAARFQKYGPSYDIDFSGVQIGMDTYDRADEEGSGDIAGLYVGAANTKSDINAVYGGKAGLGDIKSYSIGGYWTHTNTDGYIDWVMQATSYDRIHTRSALGENFNTKGVGLAMSLEEGRYVPLGANGWSLEPQAQVLYQRIKLDDGADSFGQVKYQKLNVVNARLGTRLNKTWELTNDRSVRAWVGANMWHKFSKDSKTAISGMLANNSETFKTNLGDTWGQFGLGLNGQVTKNVDVTATADYNRGLGDYKAHSVGGRLRINVSW